MGEVDLKENMGKNYRKAALISTFKTNLILTTFLKYLTNFKMFSRLQNPLFAEMRQEKCIFIDTMTTLVREKCTLMR